MTKGALAEHATSRNVMSVPVNKTIHTLGIDDNYLRTEPGMFPDILVPLYYGGKVSVGMDTLSSVWVEFDIPEDFPKGEYTTVFTVDGGERGCVECALTVEVINAVLPREDIYFTQWFHADCLANYYNVEVWSDRHWEIVESFARAARRGGINLLLAPLRLFITELLAHLRARGDDKRCFFHVSDEPGLGHLDSYKGAKAIIADLLEGYRIMDALSKIDFYREGVVDHPIPSNNHINDFLEAGVKGLWTYYCVSQPLFVSNRYISMTAWRTRSIGMQMYKYNIEDFFTLGLQFL